MNANSWNRGNTDWDATNPKPPVEVGGRAAAIIGWIIENVQEVNGLEVGSLEFHIALAGAIRPKIVRTFEPFSA